MKYLFLCTAIMCVSAVIKEDYVPDIEWQYNPWESAHGYFEVRPGAHLFYWLFYAAHTLIAASDKPLIIWVQGGPGLAASGVGNFAELGPYNMKFERRNHTWVSKYNVLFFDHPVGVGFSYVANKTLLVKTDREMAIDLSRAIKIFLRKHKEFINTPTYVIGQSYGGKISSRLAVYLQTAIEKKSLKMNFKGLAIGGGWVNPRESTIMQPKFLYNTGIIDRRTYLYGMKLVNQLIRSIHKEEFKEASILNQLLFMTLNEHDFNMNNINTHSPYNDLEELSVNINKYVKPYLKVNQSLEWNYLAHDAYRSLKSTFLMSAVSFLETILNNTGLKVVVYNGNLDATTPVAGASNWVHKLKWHGSQYFGEAKRIPIKGKRNGFYKVWKNLSFWCIFGAGHWVPEENPEAMDQILQYLTTDVSTFF